MNVRQQHIGQVHTETLKDPFLRVYPLYVLMLLLALAILLRIVYLQVFKVGELRVLAEKIQYRFDQNVEAPRGTILSEDGKILAISVPVFEVRMDVASPNIDDRTFNDSVSYLASGLSKLFGDYTSWEYKKKLLEARKDKNRYFLIRREVTYEQLQSLKKLPILCRGKNQGGLIAIRSSKREYPFGILARRTIGYIKDHPVDSMKAGTGIEKQYNSYLEGKKGRQLLQRMARGVWKPVDHPGNLEPQSGKNIVTTINSYLQEVAHHSLLDQLIAHDAEKGCLILMEVKTGEIRAMVNLERDPVDGRFKERYNIAVAERFEPGSIFKLPCMMVAMEDGFVQRTDSVFIGNGVYTYHDRVMRDSHRFDPDGWVTPENCLAHSTNVGVSRIVYDNYHGRNEVFYDRLTKMFPVEKTGIDLPGEPQPFIKNPRKKDQLNYWSAVTLPWMSIGYEVQVTPLQMLTFYNAVANGGKMVRPRLVKEIREGNIPVEVFEPEIIRENICSPGTISLAQKFLLAVVERGTGKNIKNDVYKIAGKTGTVKRNEGGRYVDKYNASFVGYFPADKPMFSCIVVIFRPNAGEYYAAQVAAPVFKKVADMAYAFSYQLEPGNKNEYIADLTRSITLRKALPEQIPAEIGQLLRKSEVRIQPVDSNQMILPDCSGMLASDALFLLESRGLKVKCKGRGVVRYQEPQPGTICKSGDEVNIVLEP